MSDPSGKSGVSFLGKVATCFGAGSLACWCAGVLTILYGDAFLSPSDPGLGPAMSYFALLAMAVLFAFASILAAVVTWGERSAVGRSAAALSAMVLVADFLAFKLFGASWYFFI